MVNALKVPAISVFSVRSPVRGLINDGYSFNLDGTILYLTLATAVIAKWEGEFNPPPDPCPACYGMKTVCSGGTVPA